MCAEICPRRLVVTRSNDGNETVSWKWDVSPNQLFVSIALLTHLAMSSFSLCFCMFQGMQSLDEEEGKGREGKVREGRWREGRGTKGRLGFHLVSASRWPLPPENYISRSQGASGSENNGREIGNMPGHLQFMHQTMECDTFGLTRELVNWTEEADLNSNKGL